MNINQLGAYSNRQQNVGILKKYTDKKYKLVHMNSMLIAGYEERNSKEAPPTERRCTQNSEKLNNSLSRSRAKIYELALCNDWEYFVTLTLDANKVDRSNLKETYGKLSKWLNNYKSRKGSEIAYVIIPEPHKNGAWHFHSLMRGIPIEHLTPFTLSDRIPARLKSIIREGRALYNWPAYAAAFGFVSMEQIIDPERCALYMTKYITKELEQSRIEMNFHVYYASKGLKRAQKVRQGFIRREIDNPDFENDYVRTKWLSTADEASSYFSDMEV